MIKDLEKREHFGSPHCYSMTSNLGTITTMWRKHGFGNFTRFEKKKKKKKKKKIKKNKK
jgi:hypothetical protein